MNKMIRSKSLFDQKFLQAINNTNADIPKKKTHFIDFMYGRSLEEILKDSPRNLSHTDNKLHRKMYRFDDIKTFKDCIKTIYKLLKQNDITTYYFYSINTESDKIHVDVKDAYRFYFSKNKNNQNLFKQVLSGE